MYTFKSIIKFNTKRVLLAFILQAAFLVFLFLPYRTVNANDMSGTITFAAHKQGDIMLPYVKDFERKYPNVKVEYLYLENYESDMQQRLEENNLPDVFFVPGCITETLYKSKLAPLGNEKDLEKKYNYLEKSMKIGNMVYGLPSFTYLNGIIYNKEVFAEAGIARLPKTIEDFYIDCGNIQKFTDAVPFYSNSNDTWALTYWGIFPFIEMTGSNSYRYTDFINNPYPFTEGKPHYEVYKLLYDLVSNGYCEKIESSKYGDGAYQLKKGDVGCMVMGSWAVNEIQGDKDVLGFMPFPTNVEGQQYVTLSTDYCYGVSAKSEHVDVAKAFVTFMLEESGYAYKTGNISIYKTDLYPDYLAELTDSIILYDSYVGNKEYWLLNKLKSGIDPDSGDTILSIIRAAAGATGQTFDDIMTEWNINWEKARPESYQPYHHENVEDGNNVILISNNEFQLSAAEREFINEKQTLNVGYLKDYAPFSYEKNGKFTGLSYGICERVEEITGLELNYIGYDQISEIEQALENNEIDILAGSYKGTNPKIKYSKSFFEVLNVYVINITKNIADLDKLKIASVRKPDEGKKNILYADSNRSCFKMVEDGKADYIETNFYLAKYYIDELGTSNLKIEPGPTYSTLHFGVSSDADPSILAILNKALYSLKSQDVQVMMLEYNTPDDPPLTVGRIIRKNPILSITVILIMVSMVICFMLALHLRRVFEDRRREVEMKKYRLLSSLSDEYMFDYDYIKHELKFDAKFREAFSFEETVNTDDTKNLSENLQIFISQIVNAEIDDRGVMTEPFELSRANGKKVWYKIIASPVQNKHGLSVYLVGKMSNVQEQMDNVKNYQEQAGTDELTKISNRRGFYNEVPKFASNVMFAVIDIDDFKGVNDSIGHAGGDAVLCFATKNMKEIFGDSAYFGRYGGDEFMLVNISQTREENEAKLAQLVKKLDTVYYFEDKKRKISISVGAVYSEDEIEVQGMFAKADAVLYERKESGKNGYTFK